MTYTVKYVTAHPAQLNTELMFRAGFSLDVYLWITSLTSSSIVMSSL